MLKSIDLRRIQNCRRKGLTKSQTAELLGFSRVTVRKYWEAPEPEAPRGSRRSTSVLAPHRELIYSLFRELRSCPKVLEVLETELGLAVGLRSLQKFIEPMRGELRKEDEAGFQAAEEQALAAARRHAAEARRMALDAEKRRQARLEGVVKRRRSCSSIVGRGLRLGK